MVRIRLARVGRKNDQYYRLVVQDGRTDPFSRYIEVVGNVSPRHHKQILNQERIAYWLSQGAKPSATVNNLLVEAGLIKGRKINVYHPGKVTSSEAPKPAEAPTAAAPAAPTPASKPAEAPQA